MASTVGKPPTRRTTAPIAGFGLEITGQILRSMPLILSCLEFYAKGIAATKRYWRYRDEFRALIQTFTTEHLIWLNIIERLLKTTLDQKDLEKFLTDPNDGCWKEEKFERMLKHSLGRNYEPYMEAITELHDTINELMQRLKMDPSGKPQLSVDQNFSEHYKRLKFSMNKSDYKDLIERFEDINHTFSRLIHEPLYTASQRDEDLKVLNWLTPVDYGPQQSDFLQRRHQGTGEWFLRSSTFQDWVNSRGRTLFCTGIPGVGKTILTSIVVEHLQNRFQNSQKVGIAYIYCNLKRQSEQNAEHLLLSLLKQLASQGPLPEAVKSLYHRHVRQGTQPTFMELSSALRSVSASYSFLFIVVDAIDECRDDTRERFLSEVFALQAECRANIFTTSRPILDIINLFDGCQSLEFRARNEDIESYLESNMARLARFTTRDPRLQNEIRTRIVHAADGIFLFAQLYLNSLVDKVTMKAIRVALEEISTGSKATDVVYQEALGRIYQGLSDSSALAMQVLLWITCTKRPLTTAELQHALAVETNEPRLDMDNIIEIEDMVSVCAGLVVVDQESQIIRFVHFSAYQYFQRAQTDLFPTAQLQITNVCITYLSYSIFESGFCKTDDEFEERLRLNILYDYAAHNWGHHARDCYRDSVVSGTEVLDFLKSDAKVQASTQALMVVKEQPEHSDYSQQFPKWMTALHLAAYFGLENAMESLLGDFRHLQDQRDSYGRTPLSWAAANGHNTVVEQLLHAGSPITGDINHRTPLSWAAGNGHESIINLLLNIINEDPDKPDNDGRTPLMWAASNGHKSVVKLLLDTGKVDVNLGDIENQTPILLAATNGHEAVVMLLLQALTHIEYGNKNAILSWAVDQRQWRVIEILLRQDDLLPDPEHVASLLHSAAKNGQEQVIKILLEQTKIVADYKGENGRTILSWAAEMGHVAILRFLLDRNDVDPESKDLEGRTPLSRAAENGHHEIVENLLNHTHTEVNGTDDAGRTPLSWAAEMGHAEVVGILLKQPEVVADNKDAIGRTILSRVAERGQMAILKLLLDRQDVVAGSQDDEGKTPISWAAENNQWEIVEYLLGRDDPGADCQDNDGQTPLSRAAEKGHIKVVELLLKRTDVAADHMDCNKRTILSRIAGSGPLSIIRLLLDRKDVVVGSKDQEGRTPLSWAAENDQWEIVEHLLKYDNDEVDCGDNYGCTALHYAAKRGHEKTARKLIGHVDVDSMDTTGNTALLTALENNNLDVVRLLVGRDSVTLHELAKTNRAEPIENLIVEGYDINTRDSRYSTPLHEAVQNESIAVLEALISSGADMNLSDMDGMTPLQRAIDLCDENSIGQLLSKSPALIGIRAEKWHSAYKDASDVLLLSETVGKGYSIHFISKEKPDERLNWSSKQASIPGRELLVHKDKSLSTDVSTLSVHGLMWYHQKTSHGAVVYFVDAWFTRRRDIDENIAKEIDLEIIKDWKCSIGWTVSQAKDDDGKQYWRTVEHFSALPYGWIPENGLDFFQSFFHYLQDYWMGICERAHTRLFELRRNVLDGQGKKPLLIGRLLEHARLWAELRQSLGLHILAAENFNREYGSRFHQEPSKDLEDIIKHFAESITRQIDRLDQTSQDLIQIEFNLVSIGEARKSTSTSASMKRLSWITFIFLPAMFASSLFGMNVNILKDNPDWRWFLLFGGAFLNLTIVGWLLFKYLRIEEWIEENIGEGLKGWLNSKGLTLPISGQGSNT